MFFQSEKEMQLLEQKINQEIKNNLTEKRFSNIMVDAIQRRFFEKEIHDDIDNGDTKKLWNRFYVEFGCIGDRTRGIRSEHLIPSYVLHVYKKYKNENSHGALELWKTYWFNIRHIDFRLSENYNENIVTDSEWFARLKSKKIYQYNTIDELENVMIKIRNELFN